MGKSKPKAVNCKAQVCGLSPTPASTAWLNPKLDADSVHQVLLSPTSDGGGKSVSLQWTFGCGTNGIGVNAWNRDGAISVAQDQGFSIVVP